MKCPSCGTMVMSGAKFCKECGASLTDGAPVQVEKKEYSFPSTPAAPEKPTVTAYSEPTYSAATPTYSAPTPVYSAPETPPAYSAPAGSPPVSAVPEMGMKWHKFLIYFSLWASIVLNVLNALTYFTGTVYQGNASLVYSRFSSMKGLDMFYGCALVALAAGLFFVRSQLAQFKKDGPKYLVIVMIASAVLSLVYNFTASSITGLSLVDSNTITAATATFVYSAINYIYYKKRAHLFVN